MSDVEGEHLCRLLRQLAARFGSANALLSHVVHLLQKVDRYLGERVRGRRCGRLPGRISVLDTVLRFRHLIWNVRVMTFEMGVRPPAGTTSGAWPATA